MASAVSDSRFKTLEVTARVPIRTFISNNKLSFATGRGFYQLNKPELIQDYKEIIIRRKSDGALITGPQVRVELGIPAGSKKFQLKLDEVPDFDVFVQSTSVNRVLVPGTEFLYDSTGSDSKSTKTDDKTTGKGAKAKPEPKAATRGKRKAAEPEPKPAATPRGKRKATEPEPKPATTPRGKRKAAEPEPKPAATPRGKRKATEPEPKPAATPRGKRKAAEPKTSDPEPVEPAPKRAARGKKTPPATAATGPAKGKKRAAPEEPPESTPAKKAKASGGASVSGPPPPGGPVEIVFSFDTTGSMYPCLTQVRRQVSETVKRLQREIPGIRIAIIAHGDYCDSYTYVTNILDFTNDEKKLCSFVETVQATGGGDWEECYELVLHEARTKLSWTPGTQRSLVMIGDAIPHSTSYSMNTLKLDWKKEAKQLYDDLGCRIYSVQALNNSRSTSFYQDLARLTNGYHLHLDQFASIVQFIMAICFREQSMDQLQAFEDEVRSKGSGVNRSLHKLFDTLAGRETTFTGGEGSGDLSPVSPSRFQVLAVDERQDIKTFVQKHSLIFKAGRGFYEFTKPEKVSDKKEVVLIDKVTGDMYTGPEACRMIGAGGSGRIKPASLEKWRVFVQSTSYNRVLMPNTGFLYEVDPDH